MKTLFIPSKSKEKIDKEYFLKISKVLPKNLALAYSIQYESLAKEIGESLEKTHTITKFCQVLGCSRVFFSKETEAVLLIGSGRFHALSLASNSNLPIYICELGKLAKISEKEIELFKQHKKTAYIKFLSADKVGILISTKPGQQNLSKALKLKERLSPSLAKVNKTQLYFFMGDFLSVQEFENFGLNSWINTGCPRLDMDSSSIINIGDLIR